MPAVGASGAAPASCANPREPTRYAGTSDSNQRTLGSNACRTLEVEPDASAAGGPARAEKVEPPDSERDEEQADQVSHHAAATHAGQHDQRDANPQKRQREHRRRGSVE